MNILKNIIIRSVNKHILLVPFSFMFLIVASVAHAQNEPFLNIQENSSTSLTIPSSTYPFTVTPFGPDEWSLFSPGGQVNFSTVGITQDWKEPGVALAVNHLTFDGPSIGIASDVSVSQSVFDSAADNDKAVGIPAFINGVATILSVTFNDLGDVGVGAPEPATMVLLSSALGAAMLRSYRARKQQS